MREGRARDGELLGGLMDWAGGRIGEEDIFDGEAGVWGFGDLMFEAGAGEGGRKDGMKGGGLKRNENDAQMLSIGHFIE